MATCPIDWLWENYTWHDFMLRVFASDAPTDAEPLYSMKLHSFVLAGSSPGHFRGHCTRLKEGSAPQSDGQAPSDSDAAEQADEALNNKCTGGAAAAAAAAAAGPFEYRLSLFPGEPEDVPKEVLCNLYTVALPDNPVKLIWMLRRADYLDLKATVYSILNELTMISSKGLTLHHAALLGSLPALQCDMVQDDKYFGPPSCCLRSKATDQMEQLTDSLLLAHLPSAPAIVTDAALLAQFTQLPLALVQRWVELDKYEVDSGNTLAVLFTAWHDAQPEPPTEQQCKQLSDMLPITAVSACFHHQALQHCKWWRPSKTVHGGTILAAQIMSAQHASSLAYQKSLKSWISPTQCARARQRATYTWTVTAAQLKQLWQDKSLTLPHFYFAGYELSHTLKLRDGAAGSGLHYLRVWYAGKWPRVLSEHSASVAEGWCDAIHSSVSMEASPSEDEWSHDNASFWWSDGAWYRLKEPELSFASLEDLVPDASASLTVECDVWYEGAKAKAK